MGSDTISKPDESTQSFDKTQNFNDSLGQSFYSLGLVEQSLLHKTMRRLSYPVLVVSIGSCIEKQEKSQCASGAHCWNLLSEWWLCCRLPLPSICPSMTILSYGVRSLSIDKPCYSPRRYFPDLAPEQWADKIPIPLSALL